MWNAHMEKVQRNGLMIQSRGDTLEYYGRTSTWIIDMTFVWCMWLKNLLYCIIKNKIFVWRWEYECVKSIHRILFDSSIRVQFKQESQPAMCTEFAFWGRIY